jgi:diaminopimelate decarboxylase
MKQLVKLIKKIKKETGLEICVINMGGGFESRYLLERDGSTIGALLESALDEISGFNYEPWLIIEPGRYIVADAAMMLTKVLCKKKSRDIRWLLVDAGTNVLIPLNSAYFETYNTVKNRRKKETYNIGDHLCYVAGTIELKRVLNNVEEGELLAIANCGAYTTSLASRYITDFPTIILLDHGKMIEIDI